MIIRKKPLFRRVETKVAFFSQTNYLFVYEYNHVYMYMLFVCLVLLFISPGHISIYWSVYLCLLHLHTYVHIFRSLQLSANFSFFSTLISLCIQLSANFSFFLYINPFMHTTILKFLLFLSIRLSNYVSNDF